MIENEKEKREITKFIEVLHECNNEYVRDSSKDPQVTQPEIFVCLFVCFSFMDNQLCLQWNDTHCCIILIIFSALTSNVLHTKQLRLRIETRLHYRVPGDQTLRFKLHIDMKETNLVSGYERERY